MSAIRETRHTEKVIVIFGKGSLGALTPNSLGLPLPGHWRLMKGVFNVVAE